MGRAQSIVENAMEREPRPEPSPEAQRGGVRQTQPDGTITVLEDWDQPTERPAPVVDRSPLQVTD